MSSFPRWTGPLDLKFTIWIHWVEFACSCLAWQVQSYPGLHWTNWSSLIQSGTL